MGADRTRLGADQLIPSRCGDAEADARSSSLLRLGQAPVPLPVKTSWVYGAVRTGNLPCIRVGRHIRFTRAMLEEWLETT